MKEKIYDILKRYWGYERFRPLQEDIILSVLSGKDTLALLPTGGGKSLCFQVPGMAIEEGFTMVVSPLIALMHDQVMNLQKKGIKAASITSAMPLKEIHTIIDDAIAGQYKFLYIAPERLQSKVFLEALPEMKVTLLAVDEAHCISHWGYDFRPAYSNISDIKKHLYNPQIPVIAVTASATQKVLEDIIQKLNLNEPNIFRQSFARKNLRYIVLYEENKIERILKIIKNIGGSGIIYVRSRNKTRELSDILNHKGIKADYFHAGLTGEEKFFKQKKFIDNQYQVMVATNAFGMGIDKPDVRYVIHYELSDSIESYFQEAGRAGRDLNTSFAVLLYKSTDKDKLLKNFEESFPSIEQIKNIYNILCNYYELAIGEGEGQIFDLDIKEIASLYKISVQHIFYALKFLQMFDFIDIEEEINQSSKCCIHYSKLDIYDFYLRHPEYEDLLKSLLRSYGGILGNYVFIDEKQLAARIHRDKNYVVQQLKFLDKENILSYMPVTGLPKITFLKDRVALSKLKIDEQKYFFLKERRKYLTEQMIEYAEQKYLCRQEFLLNYFDEKEHAPCGYCDVCIQNKRQKNIDELKKNIVKLLYEGALKLSITEICNAFQDKAQDLVIQSIREMIDDDILVIDAQEKVSLKTI